MVSRTMTWVLWVTLAASAVDPDYTLYGEFLRKYV
jgi:hypothetical protein